MLQKEQGRFCCHVSIISLAIAFVPVSVTGVCVSLFDFVLLEFWTSS